MITKLTGAPEISVETTGNEATYWLPARPLGVFRLVGLLLIGFSVMWVSIVGHFFEGVSRHSLNGNQHAAGYFMAVFSLVFALAGCIPAGIGLLVMFGRCRIVWRDGRLRVSETLGLFGWPRRLPRKVIRKFTIKTGVSRNGQPVTAGPMANMATLVAEFDGDRPRIVANGYPREWLEALAADLSARAAQSQPAPPSIQVLDLNNQPADLPPWLSPSGPQPQEMVKQPAGSKVVIQRQSASIVLEVPPAGLRKGSMGLFLFASVWCLFMLVFTCVTFGQAGGLKANAGPALYVMALFWAIGLGMMAVAVNLGRRRTTLTAGNSGLTVVQTGPYGVKRREFRRDQITAIRPGPSNFMVNNVPLPELQIHPVTGKKAGLFAGRNEGELQWMAAELMKALGIEAQGQNVTAKQVPGIMARPTPKTGGGFIFLLLVAGAVAFWFFHTRSASRPAPAMMMNKPSERSLPGPVIPGVAFSSFTASNTFKTNAWFAGTGAHADWFVSQASGPLAAIRIALEPMPHVREPGNATVFIAQDEGGFPGAILETFPVTAMKTDAGNATAPILLESAAKPELKAGVKYWVCAKSTGLWQWHFNDQNIMHNAARELEPEKWGSAGDNCFVGAFSVTVSTNR